MKLKKKSKAENILREEKKDYKYNSLHDVMDYKKPFTIFYSGVETDFYFDTLYDLGIRDFLMSYEYLKGKGSSVFKRYSDINLFIDSGAYTYQNDPKYEEYTEEHWIKHIESYLKWVENHKNNIFAIADLDLQYLSNVGYEKVYEWRKKYFEPFMLRTGIPVCFIYHEDGLDYWDYMCKRYPYVGLSLAIDKIEHGEQQLREMFRIAEKHNSLCQGMASTNTKLLVKYPFYTVDSTTWNAGLKYGEISVWTGKKMTRVKKTEFETKAFPYIQSYEGASFDLDLIREEDKVEMIRVNAYAFVLAEKFVRERLKARMYWLKEKATKQNFDSLPDDFFPDPMWFTGDLKELPEYAKKMNINPDFEGTYGCVYDMTTLLTWDREDYKILRDEYLKDDGKLISELHDLYVNRIVDSLDEKINDLIDFFRDCLEGNNTTLLYLGTNFDRTVKEREEYLDDREYEYEDIDDVTIFNKLSKYLPPSKEGEDDEETAPEIDELEDEIFEQEGIIPVRDEHGKFLKGQKKVLKPKKMFSKKFPKLACDTCYAAQRCPEYKAGYACAYNKIFDKFETRDMGDIIQAMQGIADFSLSRLQKVMMFEVLDGGLPSADTTQLINQTMGILNNMKNIYESGSTEVIRQTNIVRSDGTRESTTQIHNPSSGGILEKIFGDLKVSADDEEEEETPKIDKEKIVEAEAEVVEE